MNPLENREATRRYKRKFTDFLEGDFGQGPYKEKVVAMLDRGEKRLVININDLRNFDQELARSFMQNPNEYLPAFQDALKTYVSSLSDAPQKEETEVEYSIGVEGSFGGHHVSPRGLSSTFIRNLVCVEGIVTKCSLVRPKVVRSVHYCEKTNKLHTRNYADSTAPFALPTGTAYPTKDENGNPLTTEFGLSIYKDCQNVTVQEMPERAPAGQLPRSVEALLESDLVDRLKPGDRVQVVGVYRAMAVTQNQQTRGVFRTMVLANHIKQLAREVSGPVLTETDIHNVKELAKRDDAFELLASSLAPSIYGHEFIKKSLLLLLLGGVERNLRNGTHLRGDINMLLVGDPSTAKSQLLRFVLSIAPLAVSTSGRGSSGVGLTAAVTTDPETGERQLEAGAMVKADRGVVCIDEFDKMSPDDRVAIHEVMEQQTVTINKAGIHTSLNARCSVVAAANPVYGQYNRHKKPTENIGLPDSLLSRFDLLFIVLDNLNPEHDRDISEHVLRMHRYRRPGEYDGVPSWIGAVIGGEEEEGNGDGGGDDGSGNTPVYQKFDKLLHGSRKRRDVISIPFIQKFIMYAKNRMKPRLSPEARDYITNSYTELRAKEDMKTLPVTARMLETMIRLAEAHAKCRLSNTVQQIDAEVALDIMNYALYHEAKPQPKPSSGASAQRRTSTAARTPNNDTNGRDGDNNGSAGGANSRPSTESRRNTSSPTRTKRKGSKDSKADEAAGHSKRSRAEPSTASSPPYTGEDEDEEVQLSSQHSSSASQSFPMDLDDSQREELFTSKLNALFQSTRAQSLTIDAVDREVNSSSQASFSRPQIETLLRNLEAKNVLMYHKGVVHII